ncbi:neutral/alkaline non-lysosomal ceramidase N-terminal domain-containing protein [Myroides odoratimimus]|uniref:neutral/alkaline non-lysosomal ceramidase N-terminal domain-containing protein n=1 Tax=Myroides odoratimimus TaxID=76832 RepID=UPI002576A823|nr:neutral/alkaline non-lysosomal ceramidase N-terminal domain-containing protein [Myroides odoratimimus]MDM1457277.1 neutral/alkaline non-lysosomal ceramidase N-terminal domain-containing protein [Myroides odoratimimus]
MKKKKTNLLIIFAIYLVSLSTSFAKEKVLFAGVTKTNITPTNKDLLQNKTVHDSLYAKTIILDNQSNKIAFIIVDSQGIAQFVIDEAKKQIHKLTDFPIENIVIASTHTHTGIIANVSPENFNNNSLTEYQNFLISKLTESIITATENLQPAKIAWGKINKPEHVFNRRWYTKELNVNPLGGVDSVKMNPGNALRSQLIKPAGPTDPQINFIAIQKTDDTPLAILANYSLHYIGGIKPNELSADYYGAFDIAINKLLNNNTLNPNFVGIMSNGTSGDINNHDYSKVLPSYPYYQKMESVAQDIAEDISKEYKQLEFKSWIPIEIDYQDITVYPRKMDTQLDSNIKSIAANKSTSTVFHPEEKYFSTRIGYYKKSYSKPFVVPLQAIRLGDLAISTIPFEVFVETGLELKQRNPFKNSFTIGLANGHWGYLPTPEQHKKGGYETWITVNRVEKNTSRIFTEQLLEMFNKLKSK